MASIVWTAGRQICTNNIGCKQGLIYTGLGGARAPIFQGPGTPFSFDFLRFPSFSFVFLGFQDIEPTSSHICTDSYVVDPSNEGGAIWGAKPPERPYLSPYKSNPSHGDHRDHHHHHVIVSLHVLGVT